MERLKTFFQPPFQVERTDTIYERFFFHDLLMSEVACYKPSFINKTTSYLFRQINKLRVIHAKTTISSIENYVHPKVITSSVFLFFYSFTFSGQLLKYTMEY